MEVDLYLPTLAGTKIIAVEFPILPHLFLPVKGKNVRINIDQIVYLEARRNYTQVHMVDEMHILHVSISRLEALLPADLFCRVHRSYIVSLAFIDWFDYQQLQLSPGPVCIPLGDFYRKSLQQRLIIVV
jgi:DNA-binding LytR/AlgR family response regulator